MLSSLVHLEKVISFSREGNIICITKKNYTRYVSIILKFLFFYSGKIPCFLRKSRR